jgi:hypothetical protein
MQSILIIALIIVPIAVALFATRPVREKPEDS